MAIARRVTPGIPRRILQTRLNADAANQARIATQNEISEMMGAARMRNANQRRARRAWNGNYNFEGVGRSLPVEFRQAARQARRSARLAAAARLQRRLRTPRTPRFGGRPAARRL